MSEIKFGVNRMVAPTMELESFLDLAGVVDAVGVEFRNDLPGKDVIDGIDAARVRDLLAAQGLVVLSINAVQHFNLPASVGEAQSELKRLIGFAAQLGNPAIVMCPHCDSSDTRSRAEMARDTRDSLKAYLPILEDAGVVGLVEPLGFPESSLRDPALAVQIIAEIGSDAYRITLDTFHFAVAGMDPSVLATPELPAELIGLVHLSGVVKDAPVASFRDPDRVYVDTDDRCGNRESLKRLVAGGYEGVASFEPFSPSVHSLTPATMKETIEASIAYMNRSLEA